jgi:hypothetical protein
MFAPCDNVLVQKETDTISLISILTMILFPQKPPSDLPENSATPLRWFLFSNWVISEEDRTKEFEQRVTFEVDDKFFLDVTSPMELQHDKIHHRMVAEVHTFPVIPEGQYDLKIFLRQKGNEWEEPVASHPLVVRYL